MRVSLRGLAKSHESLFGSLVTRLIDWIINGPDQLLSIATQVLVLLAREQLIHSPFVEELSLKIQPGDLC